MTRPVRPSRSGERQQRGAALLTAMVIVTLVVTLAASMVWQQWRAVQVEAAERARVQSAWILTGALDWARLILREDARNGGPDHLGEPWAVPLAEARLSTFLAVDRDNTDDAPDAFLSGSIVDSQARYNLTNLVNQGKPLPAEVAGLERLCQALGLPDDTAGRIAQGLALSQALPGSEGAATAPLPPRTLEQLAWLGIDAATLRLLAPHVVVLPVRTTVNVNTASREALVAAIKGLDMASAERLVQVRQRTPFKTLQEAEQQIPALAPLNPVQVGVASSFFEVRGRLRLEDRVLEQVSLIERRGLDMLVLRREQVASRESFGS
jgi:general secretion pathway protein K